MKILKILVLFALASSISLGAQTTTPSLAPDPLAPVAWLAGGVWRGEARNADGKTTKIETHVERTLNGKALGISSSFQMTQSNGSVVTIRYTDLGRSW